MRVYIVNLRLNNLGKETGEWFKLPLDVEEARKKLKLTDEYGDYTIQDSEMPIEISEYTSMEELNKIYENLKKLEGTPFYDCIDELIEAYFSGLEELVERADELIYFEGCKNMGDVAKFISEEDGTIDKIPEHIRGFIDYYEYGECLEAGSGNYIKTKNGKIFLYEGCVNVGGSKDERVRKASF